MTERRAHHDHHDPDHDDMFDQGLAVDLATLLRRRDVLRLLGGASLLAVVGCSSDVGPAAPTTPATQATQATTGGSSATIAPISTGGTVGKVPQETAGPYPANGTNGVNALTESGIVRSDIRASFGTSTTTAAGVPLAVSLRIVDTTASSAPLAGAAVYIWQCDADGNYSMYSAATLDENYLRGVQQTDASGMVTFRSIYPACYPGRWPHLHFEVYPSLAAATTGRNARATSQLALPDATNAAVYATSRYASSVSPYSQVSLATDNVFRDGAELETPVMTGSVDQGYVATLTVGV